MNKIIFFVKFVIISTIIFIAWIPFAGTFVAVKYAAMDFTFKLISDEKLNFPPPSFIYGIMVNIIPFTALVLATPGVAIKRRVNVIILGAAILFFLDVFTTDLIFFFEGNIGNRIEIFMSGVGMLFFPIALWLVMLYREIFPKEPEHKGKGERSYVRAMKKIYPGAPEEKYKCVLCKKDYENIIEHLESKHKNKMGSKKVREFLRKHPGLKA